MPYYVYVPYKKREVPQKYLSIVQEWTKLERARHDVTVCYSGENKLKDLAESAQIVLLLPGKSGRPSRLSKNISIQSLRHWDSLSKHLRLTDEDAPRGMQNSNSRQNALSFLMPELAEKMIADGLLKRGSGFLTITLCFFDTDLGTKILANAFFDTLLESPNATHCTIRLNYYDHSSPLPPAKIDPLTKKKVERSRVQEFVERMHAKTPANSLFNNQEGAPQLRLEQLNSAIEQYTTYKSSRCCGLSGLLHLNGLFSSDISAKTIVSLKDCKRSDADRFKIASAFVAKYPGNYLTQCLKLVIEESILFNHVSWEMRLDPKTKGFVLNTKVPL